ncbi:MAG TPA: response regulator [Chloroflexota bacterium]|nr:response regulator [Chloroflexota bacterium]
MKCVLVVDDDPDIVDLLTVALHSEGYNVRSAVGGQALALAHEWQPNVILLDLMMPDMDGMEMSRHLRANPKTAAIPIIAMSAQEQLADLVNQMQVNDQLAKPFHLRVLYDTIAEWCGGPPPDPFGQPRAYPQP